MQGPQGDAYDTDEDEDGFYSNGGSTGSRRGRGRGRARAHRQRQSRHVDSEEDDPEDGYAINRERAEFHCRTLPGTKEYNFGEKNQDFSIWIRKFEDAVNRGNNPHSQRRHYRYCLQWLPNYLGSDAYSVWSRSSHRNTDWLELKKELLKEFEDPIIRSEWKCNLRAYVWDEAKESLHTYCSKVKRYVDTFETDLVDGSKAKLDQYYIRFVSGMPEDYQKQIKISMPMNKQNVDRAYDASLRYQSIGRGNFSRSELGASLRELPKLASFHGQNF